jgi:hypothetical protein
MENREKLARSKFNRMYNEVNILCINQQSPIVIKIIIKNKKF